MVEKIVPKDWGHEIWIVNRDYCGKSLFVKKGHRCSIHSHKLKDETFYIVKGKILLELDGKKKIMNIGESQLVMPGQKHRFTGLSEENEIIEFSNHHEDSDSYRDVSSGKVEDFYKFLNELVEEGLL